MAIPLYIILSGLFLYWIALDLNWLAKPGRILRIAGFLQVPLKMNKIYSTQFH